MVIAAKLSSPVSRPTLSLVPNEARRARPVGKASDYVGLVRKVAYSMARRLPSRVDVRDLINSGTIGLLDAMTKYDPKQNDNFEAYAEIRIRGAILDELRSLDWVPRSVRQKSHALDKTTRNLEGTLGRAPSEEEVAGSMELSMGAYHSMVRDVRSTTMLSLEDLLGSANGVSVGPVTEGEDDPLEHMCRRATTQELALSLDRLAERDRLVLTLYYLEELKLKKIGEILGVTESRVCQIHGQAIAKLKGFIAAL